MLTNSKMHTKQQTSDDAHFPHEYLTITQRICSNDVEPIDRLLTHCDMFELRDSGSCFLDGNQREA